jgi:hypothetical protein
MVELSASDASALAIVAGSPNISGDQLDTILQKTSPEARKIALKVVEVYQNGAPEPAAGPIDPIAETANALVRWARGNNKGHQRKSALVASQTWSRG